MRSARLDELRTYLAARGAKEQQAENLDLILEYIDALHAPLAAELANPADTYTAALVAYENENPGYSYDCAVSWAIDCALFNVNKGRTRTLLDLADEAAGTVETYAGEYED